MSAKIQEAQEHCKVAEKHLKTTLTRWKPDYDAAADEYNQAAQCYRIARDLKNSKDCHLKASEYYKKNHSFFHAAKALENAILVGKETTTPEDLYGLACESSSLYQQHGSGDSGAAVLDKTAKILEENSPEKAYKLYQQAAEVSAAESSSHQGMEYISKASRIMVRLKLYDQAAESIRQEIGYHLEAGNFGAVGRLTVAAVLVHLARGDVVAAEKAYKKWGVNCEAPESQTLEDLLGAYDGEDREGARRALASPFIRSMDVDYARLANTIELPKGEPMPSPGVRKNAAAEYVSGTAGPSEAQTFQAFVSHQQGQPQGQYPQGRFEDIEESPYESVTIPKKPASDDEGDFC